MLKLSIGILIGLFAMKNLQEIRASGLEPWEQKQIHRTHHLVRIVVRAVPR